jgi:putative tryptophan/tyrosine transport system substrate-binding protein
MASHIGRRKFLATLLGGAAASWPLAARAQQSAMPVIGYLSTGSPESDGFRLNAFRRGLNETGYVEGQNVAIEYRWAQAQYDRLSALAADLVRRQVTVIYAMGTPSGFAAKQATTTIPIVFNLGVDPVTFGLVASLNRPGSNATGIALLNVELMGKRLELLRELVPTVASIALLVNPTSANTEPETRDAGEATRTLGLQLNVLNVTNESEIDIAFATLARQRASALVISTDTFFTNRRDQLVALAARHGVPAIYAYREFALAGGLMSYGTNVTDSHRQAGVYTGRILKGEKPADLPVQQITKVELIINLKTAKALGLTVPLPLSGRADEVIE